MLEPLLGRTTQATHVRNRHAIHSEQPVIVSTETMDQTVSHHVLCNTSFIKS